MPPFYSKTYRLLRTTPRESQSAVSEIEDAEQRLDIQLPPSVRQWYSYHDSVRILASHSNDDPPIPVREFCLQQWDSNVLLPFKYENQGVCVWSILIDGSDDPPVYVNVDDNGWHKQAATFSDYVYSCVWDYAVVLAKPALVQAQNDPITDQTLDTLASRFIEHLRTYGWPGCTQYRFSTDHQAILIWSAENQADWFVAADDADALRSALQIVWQLDAVGPSLYHMSDIGKTVLETFAEA